MIVELWSRMKFFFLGRRRREVDEELTFHLEREMDANQARGLTPEEGRRQAVLAFGSRERTREACREERPRFGVESVTRDVKYGLRGLWRNPGFTTVAVLTLALAIGANTTIFSLMDQALLRALPVRDPGQLVVLSFAGSHPGHTHDDGGNTPGHNHEFSWLMYRDLRDRNRVFNGLIAASDATVGATWNNQSQAANAEMVSGNYFTTLGVGPAVGRVFGASDETAPGANAVAVLNFDFWKTHLGEAPVVGRTLEVNGTPLTIVGVTAPGFHSMVWGRLPDVYIPFTEQKVALPEWDYLPNRQAYWMEVVGRLKPGVTAAQAAPSLNTLFLQIRAGEFPLQHDQSARERKEFITQAHINLEAGAQGFSPMRDGLRMPLTIIMGMVLLVIAMAVVNVASLLLVRAATRVREFSVRYALGATSGQVLRQLMTEGLLLGIAGATLGLLLTPGALHLLIHWMQGRSAQEPVFQARLDGTVLAFTMGATVIASLLFSLAPAAQFRNPQLAESLKQQTNTGMGGSLRFRRTCVALQIGFSLVLIVAAGLFVRTIDNLRNAKTGFATDHLVTFWMNPQLAGYPVEQTAPMEQRVLESLAGLPGVRGVGATNDGDLVGDQNDGDVVVTGYAPKPDENFDVEVPWVSTDYLQTMGIPLLAGRYFDAGDTATSTKVAVVNASFAKHYFGSGGAALGHHVSRPRRPGTDAMIVGVVADVKHVTVRNPPVPTDYTLFAQADRATGLTFYLRTWQPPDAEAATVRGAIAHVDPKLIVDDLSSLTVQIDDDLANERTIALLAALFGMLATLLAGIGLYGILAYSMAQRTREIGIRMALGARRSTVIGLIVREVLVLAGGAIVVTIPLAMLATRAVRSVLFGVSAADPAIYAAAVLLICLVAVLAGFVPARRAASVDPARALRTE
ncbi:MAG TPA: ABC transporter permease [Acidobacteriaceae bacterium]|jgi:predicted permease|nr:ABC transporter permease [Acidobacteriaceae bacterium]